MSEPKLISCRWKMHFMSPIKFHVAAKISCRRENDFMSPQKFHVVPNSCWDTPISCRTVLILCRNNTISCHRCSISCRIDMESCRIDCVSWQANHLFRFIDCAWHPYSRLWNCTTCQPMRQQVRAMLTAVTMRSTKRSSACKHVRAQMNKHLKICVCSPGFKCHEILMCVSVPILCRITPISCQKTPISCRIKFVSARFSWPKKVAKKIP